MHQQESYKESSEKQRKVLSGNSSICCKDYLKIIIFPQQITQEIKQNIVYTHDFRFTSIDEKFF